MSVNKTRGIIIVLSILALAASLAIENKMVALILMSICISGAVFILYRHLGELTDISADNPKMKTLKGVTIFNIAVLVVCVLAAILIGTDIWKISQNGEKYFAATIVAAVIFFNGMSIEEIKYALSINKPVVAVSITYSTSVYISQLGIDVIPCRKDSLENWIYKHI